MSQTISTRRKLDRRHFLTLGVTGIIQTLAACGNQRGMGQTAPTAAPRSTSTHATAEPERLPSPTTAQATIGAEPDTPTTAPATITPVAGAEGQLQARPTTTPPPDEAASPGTYPLGLADERDGVIYVPAGYQAQQPAPLVVLLHGAGGNAHHGLSLLQPMADAAGLLLLAVDSRRQTWDIILGSYGPDVAFLDQGLEQLFARYAVDPTHLAIGGFSDGASYALSLGLTNGDLFSHIIAFSPGFMSPAAQRGAPRIFISHGTRDEVLPIEVCSRRIVPRLERAGYDVRYREFEGPHTVPADIAQESVDWFTAAGG